MEKNPAEKGIQQQKSEIEAREYAGTPWWNGPVPAQYVDRLRELFVRAPQNPILTTQDMPFPCKAVCNPGACLINGEVLLLLRVIDNADHSHLYVARSADGVGGWRVETTPLLSPDINASWYDAWGCEDPRITYLEDRGEYVIAYVGWSRLGAGVCLATTRDFRTVTRLGMVIHPYNKDAALLPRRVGGKYQLLHRPLAGPVENVWLSESEDLISWGNPRCVLEEDAQASWDSGKVGTGPPPLEIPNGWFLIFHGVQPTGGGGWEYRFGMALLDKDDPARVIMRWPEWVFGAQEPYEFNGDKGGIVFPTGLLLKDNILQVYYGAADSCVCLATADIDILRSLGTDMKRAADAARPPAPPSPRG